MTDKLSEDQWRSYVRDRLDIGDRRFEAIESRMGKNEALLATNTVLTQRAVDVSERTDRKVDEMREEVQPVTDAVKTMESGIRTIGRVGNAGAKLAKGALMLGFLWGAIKLLFSGASWSEIYAAFARVFGK